MTLMTTDRLGEAWLQMDCVVDALREALSNSNNVEAIVILQIIERAANLKRDINRVRECIVADSK